jgi:hypothetical protein
MISGVANIEKANVISDAVAVSLYLDFRPTKYSLQYPLPLKLKRIEPAVIMSDDELTDDEMTVEEERRLKKLKDEGRPMKGLAFLYAETRDIEKLLKKDRKRKEAKRQKEKQKSEEPMSPRAQEETVSSGSSSNQDSRDRTETVQPPLHVVSSPLIFCVVFSSLGAQLNEAATCHRAD